MASVTSTLRKALQQLEKDRERIDRQIGAIRSVLDESGAVKTVTRHAMPKRSQSARRPMSAAARRAASQRMKAYWEQRKAAAAKSKG